VREVAERGLGLDVPGSQGRVHEGFEGREVSFYDSPHDVNIYVEIAVDQNVAHANNLCPCDLGMSSVEL